MSRRLALSFAALLGVFTMFLFSPSRRMIAEEPPRNPDQFPTVTASNLAGRQFNLPADFEADYNIVFMAFYQQHQIAVDTWVPLAQALEKQYGGKRVRYYELPTVQDNGLMFQVWLDGVMRAGIPSPDSRDRTITLYVQQRKFAESLNLDVRQAYTLLITRDGSILWRGAGNRTPDLATQLSGKLDTLLATPSAPSE